MAFVSPTTTTGLKFPTLGGGHENSKKPYIPSTGTQIYFVLQLNRKCADRIIRIGLHRCMTAKCHENVARIPAHFLEIFFTLVAGSTSQISSYILSNGRDIQECPSSTTCIGFYLFYKWYVSWQKLLSVPHHTIELQLTYHSDRPIHR